MIKFSLKWWCFYSNPLFWAKTVVISWLFNDDLRSREREQEEKRTRNSAPYSTNKILIEYLFCTISILNSNSSNNLKALVTVKHRAWWLHCVFHISASWWFFDIILTYLITLLNTIILHRKKKRAQLKSLPHKRYYFLSI